MGRFKQIMRKRYFMPVLASIAIICMSWGTTGHFAVGLIAQRHLTSQAAAAVSDLLGAETLADVSTWADDVRGQAAYAHTDKWHYINLPGGISKESDFAARVCAMKGDNVYRAVLKCSETLRSDAGREEKVEALKFLVHFVGDLHQPMHVSHEEDRGGNSIQVKYRNQPANLHSVWDSKLLDDKGLGYEKIADRYDSASPRQVARWQQDSLMQWLWESYQASERLYAEVEQPGGRKMKRAYYKEHIAIAYQRTEMAGIRLAGMLNEIFDHSYRMPAAGAPAVADAPVSVDVNDVGKNIGRYATVCARVYGHKMLDDIKLVNLGAAYPNSPMTVVLKGRALKKWKRIDGRRICVTGTIISYKGTPEIIITDPAMLQLAKKSK